MTEEFVTPEFIDNSDPDTIQSRMMNNLPVDISDMPADFPYDFTMPTAIEISRLIQYNLTRTLMLMFPMWAWGQWLDLHGVSAKVTRKQASRASGHVTVVGTAGTIIEEGTVFCTEGTEINANCVYEDGWKPIHATVFYDQLKKLADYILEHNLDMENDYYISLFEENFFHPKQPDDLENWCGGNGVMLAVDPDGIIYPCLRFSMVDGEME